MRWMWILILILVVPIVAAQDTIKPIAYDQVVSDTITEDVFFDWWRLEAEAGQTIAVQMVASDGLVPLIGILDANADLVARSDETTPPVENGVATLEYTADATGAYFIVATRDGRENGTSTGSYVLDVRCSNCPNSRINTRQDVEFRCGDMLVTTAATLEFTEDIVVDSSRPFVEFYRLTVYGIGEFEPVIRVAADIQEGYLDCTDDGQQTVGDMYQLPDGTTGIIPEDTSHAAQLTLRNPTTEDTFGAIVFNIGSRDGKPGRYVAVLEGFRIHERGDQDGLVVRLGPLARDTDMLLYMIGNPDNRLDPTIQTIDREPEQACDDAGQRGCEDVPSFNGAEVTIHVAEGARIQGDRFDAGLRLHPGSPEAINLILSSRDNRTTGDYSLVFIGELPAR